jgi:hypothetical protein
LPVALALDGVRREAAPGADVNGDPGRNPGERRRRQPLEHAQDCSLLALVERPAEHVDDDDAGRAATM